MVNAPIKPPGTVLKELIERLGYTQRQAAFKLGMSQPNLNRMINGYMKITPEIALKIEAEFKASAEQFIYQQAAHDLAVARSKESV